MSIKDYWQKIKGQCLAREGAIFLTLAIVLAASFGFGLGRLSKIQADREPIRIETASADSADSAKTNFTQATTLKQTPVPAPFVTKVSESSQTKQTINSGEVVASKNGKAYYYPWCSGVSRIKPANKVFFSSPAAAAAAGLTPAKNCPGLQ